MHNSGHPFSMILQKIRYTPPEFLAVVYEAFRRNEKFWREHRGGAADGLFHYDGESDDPQERVKFGGWESGWDDSPRWDGGVNQIFPVDLNCYMILFYRSLREMAEKLHQPEDAALWVRREQNLTREVENRLWDEQAQCYLDYDFGHHKFATALTPASFMPLFIKTASAERAARMAEQGRAHLSPGWPSAAYDHPEYDPAGYWRGRTWLNIAYFALKGLNRYGYTELAETGRRTLLDWVAADPGSIYENYNSQTTCPMGAPRFSWSAVFVIKFLLDWDLPDDQEIPSAQVRD